MRTEDGRVVRVKLANLEVRVENEHGRAQAAFAQSVVHGNDHHSLAQSDVTVRIQRRTHGPPELAHLHDKLVTVIHVNAQAGWVYITNPGLPANACEQDGTFCIGFGCISIHVPQQQRRRAGTLYNESPLDGYARAQHQRQRLRDDANLLPNYFDTFTGLDPKQRSVLAQPHKQLLLIGGSGVGKTLVALKLSYDEVLRRRRASGKQHRAMVVVATRHNCNRLQAMLVKMNCDAFFEVHVVFELLALDEDVKPVRTEECLQKMLTCVERGRYVDVNDRDSTRYALAYKLFARVGSSEEFVAVVLDEINTIDFDIPWLLHRGFMHYVLENNPAAPHMLFGGRSLYATGDIFQLACAAPCLVAADQPKPRTAQCKLALCVNALRSPLR